MKRREKPLGDKNLIGANVTKMRMLYHISQKELAINIAKIFNMRIDDLFENVSIRPSE